MPQPKKQYIIRKYILARSAAEALRIEHKFKAVDCWIDDNRKQFLTLKYRRELLGKLKIMGKRIKVCPTQL